MTLQDVLRNKVNILDAMFNHPSGMQIIPASLALSFTDTGLTRLKESLTTTDGYILIDAGTGLGKDVLSILEVVDSVILITNPNIPSIATTFRMIEVVQSLEKGIMGVIINRAGKSYEISRNEIELLCSVPILGTIPEDENVRKSVMFKKPVIEYKPYSPASISLLEIAANMLNKPYKLPRFIGLRNLFSR